MEGTQDGNSGVINTIADAVAELDRREAARGDSPAEKTEEQDTESSADLDADDSETEVATDEKVEEEQEPAKQSVEFDGKVLEIPEGTPPELVEATQKLASDLKADYTRKTQAVAEERRVIESAKQQTIAQAQQLQSVQATLAQMAQELIGSEPDLSLAQQDPQTYLVQKGLYEKRVQHFQALKAQGDQLLEAHRQEMAQQRAEFQKREAEALMKVMPELQSPDKLQAFRQQAVSVGQKYGITPEEVVGITDHRMILALRDLAAFHAGKAAAGDIKTKLQNVPPKVAKPGASQQGDPKSARAAQAKQQFLKSARTDRDLRRYIDATS